MEPGEIVWLKWRIHADDRVEVIATLEADGSYRRERKIYESLDQATDILGASFGEVVDRAIEAGSDHGRWRP